MNICYLFSLFAEGGKVGIAPIICCFVIGCIWLRKYSLLFLSEASASAEKSFRSFFAFEALMITFIGTAKLIGTLFELLLDDCFSHEFFVELEIEFNIEGGPFGSEAAHK